jgi:hypothetical protein
MSPGQEDRRNQAEEEAEGFSAETEHFLPLADTSDTDSIKKSEGRFGWGR